MLCACHTTPTQKLLCLHVFRQARSPQRVDCLALKWETVLSVSQGHSDALPHRKSNQGFSTFRLLARRLYQLSPAAASSTTLTCKQMVKSNHHYDLKHLFLETFDLLKILLRLDVCANVISSLIS